MNTGNSTYNKYLVWIMATVAATGGLLFGFDTGVISGALPFLEKHFNLDETQEGALTAIGIVGAVLGAIVSGWVSDQAGRKKVILVAAVIFLLGAFWCGISPNLISLEVARFFLGIAIGIASFSTPLYIAEISPAKIRGTLVSMFQLLITVGLLCASVSDAFLADNSNSESWRPMFYTGMIPALILLVGMFFLPESPRWLLSKNREAEAKEILKKIEEPDKLESEINRMKEDISRVSNEMKFTDVIDQKWIIYPFMIAVCIMLFQQAVGINTVMYYGPKMFMSAGFEGEQSAIVASTTVNIINVVFTIVSLFLIDRLGRRKLFFIGMSIMMVALVLIAVCFIKLDNLGSFGPYTLVGSMLIYVAAFAISMGPLGWLIITEVFPMKVRGVGSSIGSCSNWGFNALIVWGFFYVVKFFTIIFGQENTGLGATFIVFAVITLIGMLWGYKYLPETKGLSLEAIEKHWENGGKPNELKYEKFV